MIAENLIQFLGDLTPAVVLLVLTVLVAFRRYRGAL